MVNNGKLIEYSLIQFPKVVDLVDYVAYVPRLGFQPNLGSDTCQ